MSDFETKMLHICFPLELRPGPLWGSLSAPQTPSRIKESTSNGREGLAKEDRDRRLGERERREGKPQSSHL